MIVFAVSRQALFAVAGLLGISFSMSAQQLQPAGTSRTLNYNASLRVPGLSVADGGNFPFVSAFDRLEPVAPAFLPQTFFVATTTAKPRAGADRSTTLAQDSSKDFSEVRRPVFDYAGGEIGFLYGRSTGKFARDFEQGYIVGGVGNEHVQISAGAAYEHSSGRDARFGR